MRTLLKCLFALFLQLSIALPSSAGTALPEGIAGLRLGMNTSELEGAMRKIYGDKIRIRHTRSDAIAPGAHTFLVDPPGVFFYGGLPVLSVTVLVIDGKVENYYLRFGDNDPPEERKRKALQLVKALSTWVPMPADPLGAPLEWRLDDDSFLIVGNQSPTLFLMLTSNKYFEIERAASKRRNAGTPAS